MSCCASCGEHACACGCGPGVATPLPIFNRPGLSQIKYRVGEYHDFVATMQAGLSDASLPALARLNTREPDDAAMALIDGWAATADVLTFYQERIANEGYLRTATERRSVLELGRLVDYRLRPGVAATAYLAYTIEKDSPPVTLPTGSKAQSIPAPGEQMQTFETAEPLDARFEWNVLRPRLTRPQDISIESVTAIDVLWVADITTQLRANDRLVFMFGELATGLQAIRFVSGVEIDTANKRTKVMLQPADPVAPSIVEAASFAIAALETTAWSDEVRDAAASLRNRFETIRWTVLLDSTRRTVRELLSPRQLNLLDVDQEGLSEIVADFHKAIGTASQPETPQRGFAAFVQALSRPPTVQPTNSKRMTRDITTALGRASDVRPQLLVNFERRLASSFYTAWTDSEIRRAPSSLSAVYVLRMSAPLFGYNAPRIVSFEPNADRSTSAVVPILAKPDGDWEAVETRDRLYLDSAYEGITAGSLIVITEPNRLPVIGQIAAATVHPRSEYGISSKTTDIQLENDNPKKPVFSLEDSGELKNRLRQVQVYAQSEPLVLAEEVLTGDIGLDENDPLSGTRLMLDTAVDGLQAGRWVIVEGRRADVPGTDAPVAAELVMLQGVEQGTDAALAADTIHSTLLFANAGLAYRYKRDSVSIYANVARATHGETRREILGSGDGSKAAQTFVLKQSPLTYVSAANAQGVDSSLTIRVNNVEWHETPNLAFVGDAQRSFVTAADDDQHTTITFGNGVHGARLPTGINNVTVQYRNGIGKPGNVKSRQISLLASRPLGVKEVVNPLAATGGADPETRDQARTNVPLAVMALDRLVSLRDYSDFSRTFAGVGKAAATKLRNAIIVTIAGAEDIPIDVTSDLYRNLTSALMSLGDPMLPVQVHVRELLALTLSARVGLEPDYAWELVEPLVRAALLATFGFERRELGQSAYVSEVIACIHSVRGVAWVDVDAFAAVDRERLIAEFSNDDASDQKRNALAAQAPLEGVRISPARVDAHGTVLPAQIGYFLPTVPDTLLLQEART